MVYILDLLFFIAGMIVGGVFGMTIFCMLQVSKFHDDEECVSKRGDDDEEEDD